MDSNMDLVHKLSSSSDQTFDNRRAEANNNYHTSTTLTPRGGQASRVTQSRSSKSRPAVVVGSNNDEVYDFAKHKSGVIANVETQ